MFHSILALPPVATPDYGDDGGPRPEDIHPEPTPRPRFFLAKPEPLNGYGVHRDKWASFAERVTASQFYERKAYAEQRRLRRGLEAAGRWSRATPYDFCYEDELELSDRLARDGKSRGAIDKALRLVHAACAMARRRGWLRRDGSLQEMKGLDRKVRRTPLPPPCGSVIAAERIAMVVEAVLQILQKSEQSPRRMDVEILRRILLVADGPESPERRVELIREAMPVLIGSGSACKVIADTLRDPTPSELRYRGSLVGGAKVAMAGAKTVGYCAPHRVSPRRRTA